MYQKSLITLNSVYVAILTRCPNPSPEVLKYAMNAIRNAGVVPLSALRVSPQRNCPGYRQCGRPLNNPFAQYQKRPHYYY